MTEQTKEVLARLKTIEGHVRGVQRMVEEGAYCIDLIRQTKAIQRAIDRVNHIILERHLNTCVTTAVRGEDPEDRQRVLNELLQVFDAADTR